VRAVPSVHYASFVLMDKGGEIGAYVCLEDALQASRRCSSVTVKVFGVAEDGELVLLAYRTLMS